MQFLLNIATLFMGAAAAVSVAESASRGAKKRSERQRLKRGSVLPREAARELEHRIGGRVAVGEDLNGPLLVVMRLGKGMSWSELPTQVLNYRVRREPTLTVGDEVASGLVYLGSLY